MSPPTIVALAGGVGAARLLRGLAKAVPPSQITAIVNTGDDREFYGVHVSPDLDIVTYTLAGAVDLQKGYGLVGDGFRVVDRLGALGHPNWFRLGDEDLANSLHRTLRLREGAGLSAVTEELRRAYGLEIRILPMSEDPCPTYVELGGGRSVHFEEYLARDGAPDDVEAIDLSAARAARPGPGVVRTILSADIVVVCPSNPLVSIGPIVAIPGVREALSSTSAPIVAISPIVGGAPIKGPADRLMRGVGVEVTARGVASIYREWVQGFVLDTRDEALAGDIEAMGMRVTVTDTVMVDVDASARLAERTLALARELA